MQRRNSKLNTHRGDLAIESGEFLVTDSGVTCKLKDPLTKLSGHYKWDRIPLGIATLKLLIVGPDTDAFEFVMKLFSDKEQKQLADGTGTVMSFDDPVTDDEAFIARDIERLLSWIPTLASKCPYPSVVTNLNMLPTMPPDALGDFVGRELGIR